MTRKIILNLAMSLDGYIAEDDGGFSWISGDENIENDTEGKFDFSDFMQSVDTLVMGKEAYLDCGIEDIEDFTSKRFYVATHEDLSSEHENVEFISGDIVTKIKEIQKEAGKDIWLFGGGGLIDAFIKADIIDEYIIGVIPIILGNGRRLFYDGNPQIKLKMTETTIQEGVIISRYIKRG